MNPASIFIASVLLVAPGATPASACTPQFEGIEDGLVLEIDDDEYSLHEVLEYFESRHQGHVSLLSGESELRRLVERFRDHRLFVMDALASGLAEDPVIVGMVRRHRLGLVRGAFLEQETTEGISVGQQEVQEEIDRLHHVHQVQEIGTVTRAAALRAIDEIRAGRDFAAVAMEISILPSASQGGHNLPRRPDQFPDAVRDWLAVARIGERSPPLVSPSGYMVVALRETMEQDPPEAAVEKTRVLQYLLRRKSEARKKELLARLEDRFGVGPMQDIRPEWMAQASEEPGDRIIVGADGVAPVTLQEIRDSLALPSPPEEEPDLAREAAGFVARQLMNERLLDEAALGSELAQDEEIEEKVELYRDNLLVNYLKNELIFKDVAVSEDELRAIYEERKEEQRRPPEAEVRHIVVRTEQIALDALQEIRSGMDFEEVAKVRSMDLATSGMGGRVGWVTPSRIQPELVESVFEAGLGEVSGPIQTRKGWHLVEVLRRRMGEQLAYEEARLGLYREELGRRRREAVETWASLLRDRVPWRIHDGLIEEASEAIRRIHGDGSDSLQEGG